MYTNNIVRFHEKETINLKTKQCHSEEVIITLLNSDTESKQQSTCK